MKGNWELRSAFTTLEKLIYLSPVSGGYSFELFSLSVCLSVRLTFCHKHKCLLNCLDSDETLCMDRASAKWVPFAGFGAGGFQDLFFQVEKNFSTHRRDHRSCPDWHGR